MRISRRLSRHLASHVPEARGTGGFALPWTMFALLLVALMAAGGFLITWLDGQSARAFSRATQAFFVAEGGLQAALAEARGPSPSVDPVTLGGGTATVSFEPLIDLRPGERVFRVTSRGVLASGGVSFERSVGQLMWVADPPRVPGALVLRGTVVGTPQGTISGLGSTCPQQPSSVAGVAYWGNPPWVGNPPPTITGSPHEQQMGAGVSVAAATGVRWTELLAGWGPSPDATVPPDSWPSAGTGGGWPSIRIPGSGTLGAGSSGRGTLVVESDLTLGDGFAWEGLILVGGALRLSGNVSIRGALASGLAGGTGVAADFGGHTIDVRFDACAVLSAATRLTPPTAVIPGTWYDSW